MAGGPRPTRHPKLSGSVLGALLVGLAIALAFVSGYYFGADRPAVAAASQPNQQAAASQPNQQVAGGLPAPQHSGHASHRSGVEHRGGTSHRKPATRSFTVGEGDTLSGIAASIAPHADPQVIVRRIAKLNSLKDTDSLEVGQRLKVPDKSRGARQGRTRVRPSRHGRTQGRTSHLAPKHVARPVSVSIPRLDLHQDLIQLNVIGGTLQVPTDYSDVGWWRDGPAPGAPGSAVLVGHVDSKTGPAVFYTLSAIQLNDPIRIGRADGTTSTFRVSDVTLYPRESFPSSKVYRTKGKPVLTLVTCGGTYDRTAGHYTGNLVVTARPASGRS